MPLKLRSDVHEQLALDFNLSGLPATVLVAPNREIVAVHQGYLGPERIRRVSPRRSGASPWIEQLPSAAQPHSTNAIQPGRVRATLLKRKRRSLPFPGYCPVSLIKGHKLVQGQVQYTVQHDGRIYRFADRVMIDLFRKEPHRYVPLNGGSCPVTQLDKGTARPGDPKWGVLYRDQLFLCATEAERRLFLNEPRALLHGRCRRAGILCALHRAVGPPRSRRLAA